MAAQMRTAKRYHQKMYKVRDILMGMPLFSLFFFAAVRCSDIHVMIFRFISDNLVTIDALLSLPDLELPWVQ